MPDPAILRVFPRRTAQTPTDPMAFVGDPPLIRPDADEVHVSVTFTWDKPRAEYLAEAWGHYYKTVKIGGPAYGDRGETFTAGMYVRPGVTFTSRGCPNRCGFCYVPKREGALRELSPIVPGNTVKDNNLLACSPKHFDAVMRMLTQERRVVLSGGLEAARLTPWHVCGLAGLWIKEVFLAYDRQGELDAVRNAAGMLTAVGFTRRQIRCFVLVGYQGDTPDAADKRLHQAWDAGTLPFAMRWRGDDGQYLVDRDWHSLVRQWSRPAAMFAEMAHAE